MGDIDLRCNPMEQCSICLDEVATSVPALACGHRFHAACLARFGAVGTPSSTSRRGTLAACPNCRTVSRVSIVAPVETHSVGDRVSALWGHQNEDEVVQLLNELKKRLGKLNEVRHNSNVMLRTRHVFKSFIKQKIRLKLRKNLIFQPMILFLL